MALVALQHRLDNALRDLEHEHDLRTRLEADLDREREARTRLEADLVRLSDAHHEALAQLKDAHEELARLNREHREELARLSDAHHEALAQLKDAHEELARLNREHREELARVNDAHHEALARVNDAHHEELARLNREHREELARVNDAHHESLRNALVQLNREHRRDICGRIDRVLGANAQISNRLTDLQRVAKREKGTTAPSRPLEHYYLLTEFDSEQQSKSIRCTSGQKQYCVEQRTELILDGGHPLRLCKSGNGIDLRQYVKTHTNQRIKDSLDPEYRPLSRDLRPHCTAIWWTWRPGTNISYDEFRGFIDEAIHAFNELSPLLAANDWSRLVLEERIDDEFVDLIRDDDEEESDIEI
ncbi:hypothetical protein FI667_g8956, partial [Globisporangium splendens]